jgi:iron-sulfur cluster repair protein YtfE (RIC family)
MVSSNDMSDPVFLPALSELTLQSRDCLPDSLRVLLKDYPRARWSDDPNFDGLTRFWMERHAMFRVLLDRIVLASEAIVHPNSTSSPDLDPTRAEVARYGNMLIGELHGHHRIEDLHYFPVLAKREPAIARGFEILDRDHHALAESLNTLAETLNALLSDAGQDDAGRRIEQIMAFRSLLDRHLEDEEDLVVPVILRHGDP